jgi:predicted PurR-regulated permease PerM
MTWQRGGKIREHARITWTALKRWLIAQLQDAALVGVLWLLGLLVIGVPPAPLWAALGMLFQFVPHIGTVLSLIGPAVVAAFSADTMKLIYVLILYAAIVALDGLVLQPILMKRSAKVPVWASIVMPLVLGILFNIWGLLLAPPLLAIVYTYRERRKKQTAEHTE